MVAERDLVAAAFFGEAVEISAAHAGTEIAGGFFDRVYSVENTGLTEFHRDSQKSGIFFDQASVLRKVTRIHADKDKGKGKLIVTFQFLKELCHEHGVFASGDTDGNAVAFLYQLILNDCLFKAADQVPFELFAECLFYIASAGLEILPAGSCVRFGSHWVNLLCGITAYYHSLSCSVYLSSQ